MSMSVRYYVIKRCRRIAARNSLVQVTGCFFVQVGVLQLLLVSIIFIIFVLRNSKL